MGEQKKKMIYDKIMQGLKEAVEYEKGCNDMKPDYNRCIEFTSAAEVSEFVTQHYAKYTVRSFPGEQSFGWFGAGNELGFYCSIKGKGYAFYPKEEGK